MAINVVKDPRTAGWKHRPAFVHNRIEWSSPESANFWTKARLQAIGFQHKSSTFYALAGGRVFRFMPAGGRAIVGECLTVKQRLSSKEGWVTGIPGGAIIQDGRNLPLYCRGRSVVQVGTRRQDIRIGRAGVYMHGRYVYVTMSGKAILVSDLNDPVSMQEAVDSNVYGWEAPDSSDTIMALSKYRIAANDVELGNLAFSTERDIFTVDLRGARTEWGTNLGRVSVAIPDVSFAGGRAAAVVNANVVFMAAQKDLNLCMINQLGAQFQRADAFSGQFLEASEWFEDAFKDYSIVASHGADVLVAASPRIHDSGQVYHRWLLAFQAVRGTEEGLKFQGGWLGPQVIDVVSSQEFGFLIAGISHNGGTGFWTLADAGHDTTSTGQPRPVCSAVVTRGYTHKEMFQPKIRGSQDVYLHDICGPVDTWLSHRIVVRGEWKSTREKSFTMSASGTVGPIGYGDSDATAILPGAALNEFFAEQVLFVWTGQAILAGVASSATFAELTANGSDFGAETVVPTEFDPLSTCDLAKPMVIPSTHL
jgi:hypothetical protein